MTKVKKDYDFLSSILLGAGSIFMLSPFFLMWWITGDYDRYIWIINGPAPYSNFGSSPHQLFMCLGLELVGLSVFAVGKYLRKISR